MLRTALLSQEGSVIALRSRGGWFQNPELAGWSLREPPRRFAPPLLTQEGSPLLEYQTETPPDFMKAVLLGFILFAQGISQTPADSGSITGTVKTSSGAPAAGVRVTAMVRPSSPAA